MIWLALLVSIAVIHFIAIVAGRRTTGALEKTAFASGLLGFLTLPLLLFVALKGSCIAGACGHGQDVVFYLVLALFCALAVISGVCAALLAVQRART